ncbi:hypothetical protein EYF80_045472 [Liparis tanakae]|uniref:Uncharacterized protein n=1 Tax=Liparis tanakae TaxID=230148 RepID=A0A4Z2FT19_9TELE|nr:hypothetical protein EYF80_045472 [Liparis tanakae]
MRPQPGAHSERGALALGRELAPIRGLGASSALHLDHVAQHRAAAVVAGARPGQHEAAGGHQGDHGAGGRGLGPVWVGEEELKSLQTHFRFQMLPRVLHPTVKFPVRCSTIAPDNII